MKSVVLLCSAAMLTLLVPAVRADVVWHDPWLNWDFKNLTGQMVNDLDIIVDDPSGTFNPNPNDPSQVFKGPFPNFTVTNIGDYDGDGDADTRIRWSGAVIPPGMIAHGGLYMLGSGRVLDAYWTFNGQKVGNSTAITYERTEIRGDPEVHMHLNIANGWWADHPGEYAGWTQIRTFVNLPAGLLNLPDINDSLNLDALSAYEVTPINAATGLPILRTDQVYLPGPDSFFDVFLSEIPPEKASPNYEALLYAQVLNQGGVIGQFWNLNPQSPEPGTLAMFAVGLLFMRRAVRKV